MTRESDLIGLIEGYLDDVDGHTFLPDTTRDAIRARLPSTSQRPAWWPGWRFPEMNTIMKYGLGAAAAVAAVAVIGLVALNNNVGAAPLPSEPPDTTYTSERHHYTLLFPDESWEIIERPGEWAPATPFNERSSGLDVADKVGEDEPWVLITSQPLDLEPDAWLARYDDLGASYFPQCSVDSSEDRTIDGEQARVNRYECDPASDGAEAVMFHDDRVFVVRVFHEEDVTYDPQPLLDEFLEIFRFSD